MSLILQSSGGGQITIQEPATASNFTQTLPAATGTVQVSGNQPAFSAWQSSSQNLTASTVTKVLFQTEEFDTNNNFASSRFTPTVAGYYQFNSCVYFSNGVGTCQTLFFKNGSNFKSGNLFSSVSGVGGVVNSAALIYCNGSTDYVELFGFQSNGGTITALQDYTYFQAVMVRAA